MLKILSLKNIWSLVFPFPIPLFLSKFRLSFYITLHTEVITIESITTLLFPSSIFYIVTTLQIFFQHFLLLTTGFRLLGMVYGPLYHLDLALPFQLHFPFVHNANPTLHSPNTPNHVFSGNAMCGTSTPLCLFTE